jgi:hypothetical protein
MELKEHNFKVIESLSLETSYGTVREKNDVELNVTVGIKDDSYGWFELYDIESGGEEWYAEGGLWFDNKTLTDYDGVFALPKCVEDKLIELGYDLSKI